MTKKVLPNQFDINFADKATLKGRVKFLEAQNETKDKEIASLKSSIGSYKAANTRMKNDLEKCKKEAQLEVADLHGDISRMKREYNALNESHQKAGDQIAKLIAHGKEADVINEEKAERILNLEKQLDAATKDIAQSNDANATLNEQLNSQRTVINDLKHDNDVYKANQDWYNALPWYRKMFVWHI